MNYPPTAALTAALRSSSATEQQAALATVAHLGARQPRLVLSLIPDIVALLHADNDETIARSCWALGQLGRERPQEILAALPVLEKLLQHPVSIVRQCSVWSLGQIGEAHPGAIRPLLPALLKLAKDPDSSVRQKMLWACEGLAREEPAWLLVYLDVFLQLLQDPDVERVQREVPPLLACLAQQKSSIQPLVVPPLLEKTQASDDVLRMHAREALIHIMRETE